MKAEQANRIIAEFMGTYNRRDNDGYWLPSPNYQSLDALVPVWEKLRKRDFKFAFRDNYEFLIITTKDKYNFGDGETIQQAACIATAKTIKELEDRE